MALLVESRNDLDIGDTVFLFFFFKLLTQVLNRVTASSNLFENVTRLHLPGNVCGSFSTKWITVLLSFGLPQAWKWSGKKRNSFKSGKSSEILL